MKEMLKKMDKKKLYLVGGFFIVIVIILFGGAFVYNKFFYKRSYSEIEEIMVSSAKNYLSKNKKNYPKNYNEEFVLSDRDLVAADEMKDISSYLKDETSDCTGKVTVTNINGKYRYTPTLSCGSKYQTIKFIDYIKKVVPIVSNGNGLYNMNDELVYRGDSVKNYIQFDNHTYRIVKFSGDSASIIYTERASNVVWDDRYNAQKKDLVGINDYSVSRIKDTVDNFYQKNITSNGKMLVVAHSLNIGKRAINDTDKTLGLEKSAMIENQFIGLLSLGDYLNASLDSNCTTSVSPSCMNYNYLSKFRLPWWTVTGVNDNTYQVYRVAEQGSSEEVSASGKGYIRPVISLSKDALYVSGTGSKADPYVVK